MIRDTRQFRGRSRSILILIFTAAVAALLLSGCEGELPDDGPTPVITAAGARRFAEKTLAAGQVALDTGRFELTVTDQEVTSFLNVGSVLLSQAPGLPVEGLTELQDIPELEGVDIDEWRGVLEQRERLPDIGGRRLPLHIVLKEPAVHFRGTGRMIIRGNVALLMLRLPVRVVAAPRASEGELVLDFVEGQLGKVNLPEFLFDAVARTLSNAILMGQDYAVVSEISVSSGTLTVRGSYQR